ncbi:hypothetical protein Glove_11g72 [Diversispora epigaea]|uniref:Pinin/SDK/MemA protein domain-containing protein n=1 Tax=Diversispora epigaea TaxID=1348612 RepID=A0A397JY06_9GLOM|nr:hypothetical protein Glove_11g72 [Diversispora epigaea]
MATEVADRVEIKTESVTSQPVITSSTSPTTRRTSRNDKRRASNELSRQNTEETKRPRLDIKDAEVKKRGQRIFGVLLGTLTKFKNDIQNKTEADIKREQIVQKTQDKLKKEHEELVNKMKKEEEERKEKIAKEKKEAEEKRLKELQECWTTQKKNLANFLRTNTEPSLYYLPARVSQPMVETIARQKRQLVLESTSSISRDDNNNNNNNNVIKEEVTDNAEDIEMSDQNDKKVTSAENIKMETDQPEIKDEKSLEENNNNKDDQTQLSSSSVVNNNNNNNESQEEEGEEATIAATTEEGEPPVFNKTEESVVKDEEHTDSKDDPVEY